VIFLSKYIDKIAKAKSVKFNVEATTMKALLRFIYQGLHSKTIMAGQPWKKLTAENPTLTAELHDFLYPLCSKSQKKQDRQK
jgi:hypothetical protein